MSILTIEDGVTPLTLEDGTTPLELENFNVNAPANPNCPVRVPTGPRLEELRERVRDRMASHVTDSFLTNERVNRAINHALRQVTAEHDWFWLQAETTITTAVGDDCYALPSDFFRTDSIYNQEVGTILISRSIRDIMQTTDRQGPPIAYAIFGNTLKFLYIPDKAYTLLHLYIRREPELLGDGERPFIVDPFVEGVIEYAAYLLFRATRESDKASEALTSYTLWLRRTQDNTKQTRAPIRVTVRSGSVF